MRLFGDFLREQVLIGREERVGRFRVVDEREIELADEWKRLFIYLRATADVDLIGARLLPRDIERFFKCVGDEHAVVLPFLVAREDDIGASRQRLAQNRNNRFERLPPNDDGMPERKPLEAPQIVRDVPEKRVAVAELAVPADSDDDGDIRCLHSNRQASGPLRAHNRNTWYAGGEYMQLADGDRDFLDMRIFQDLLGDARRNLFKQGE